MIPVGEVKVRCEFKGRIAVCNMSVIDEKGIPLMGRDLMTALGFEIIGVHRINAEWELKNILDEYGDLFDGSLDCYNREPIDLNIGSHVKPIFIKPQPVPFAFKAAIDEEIDRLIKIGVIEKVSDNDWGTPLVPILKSNGKIRICTNYKLTINKHLEDIKHPIPRVDELYTKVRGGKKFKKLDMSAAYNQLRVSKETSKFLAWSTHRGIFLVNRFWCKTSNINFSR